MNLTGSIASCVTSAAQMYDAVMQYADSSDIIVKAAAVADYRPKSIAPEKIKKSDGEAVIELERTADILKELGKRKKKGQVLCGFSMETENLCENSRKKLKSKNADIIAANNLRTEGAGFGTETNVLTLITADKEIQLEKMSKDEAAHRLIDCILSI